MRAKCLVHADCRAKGKMVFPSGRAVHLKTKTGDIKDLNANFVSHLEKRDAADGTSHADTVRHMLPNYVERILIIRKGRVAFSTVSRKLGIEGALS